MKKTMVKFINPLTGETRFVKLAWKLPDEAFIKPDTQLNI